MDTESEITKALVALDSEYADERREAVAILGKARDVAALPKLLDRLQHEQDYHVRNGIAEALACIGDPVAVPHLLSALCSKLFMSDDVVRTAVLSFDASHVLQPALDILQSEECHVTTRCLAAEILGELGNPVAIKPLFGAMRFWNINLVNAAAKALVRFDKPGIMDGFLEALADETPSTCEGAATILGGMGENARIAVPRLLDAYAAKTDWRTRTAIVEALGNIGDPAAIPVLTEAMNEKKGRVQYRAIACLGRIGTPEVNLVLKKRFEQEPDTDIQRAILGALARSLGPAILPLLEKPLQEEAHPLKETAIEIAANLGQPAKGLMKDFLQSAENGRLVDVAVRRMGQTANPFWAPLLLTTLCDPGNKGRDYWRGYLPDNLIRALASTSDATFQDLVALVESEDAFVRQIVAGVLSRTGNPQAISVLAKALRQGEMSAADALATIGSDDAINELLSALRDEQQTSQTKVKIQESLLRTGNPRAIAAVREIRSELSLPPRQVVMRYAGWGKRYVDEDDAYRILEPRAMMFYDTLASVQAFTPKLSREAFLERVSPVVREQAQVFLYDRSQDAFEQLGKLFTNGLPLALRRTLAEYLPSTREEIYAVLTRRAMGFHQGLGTSGAYVRPLTEQEFRERTHASLLDHTVRYFNEGTTLDSHVVWLPESLLFDIKDALALFNFDYEAGYRVFFERAVKAFEQTPHQLRWDHDESQHQLRFWLNDRSWLLEDVAENDELGETMLCDYLPEMSDYLAQHDWTWYNVMTGDQTASVILLPQAKSSILEEYLPPSDDPRVQLFYGIDGKFFPTG